VLERGRDPAHLGRFVTLALVVYAKAKFDHLPTEFILQLKAEVGDDAH
jgi:hypothetical protein